MVLQHLVLEPSRRPIVDVVVVRRGCVDVELRRTAAGRKEGFGLDRKVEVVGSSCPLVDKSKGVLSTMW